MRADPKAVTYRTHRMGRDLQLWFVEGRDYRMVCFDPMKNMFPRWIKAEYDNIAIGKFFDQEKATLIFNDRGHGDLLFWISSVYDEAGKNSQN